MRGKSTATYFKLSILAACEMIVTDSSQVPIGFRLYNPQLTALSRSNRKRLVMSLCVQGSMHLGKRLVQWAVLALFVHLIWEIAHVRLYTIWRDEAASYIAYSVLHCTVGDGLIATGTYLLSILATRRVDWPAMAPRSGALVAVMSGVGYTAYSEWVNVYYLYSWQYLPSMPLLGGIGVTPLLQWIVVPLLMIALWRRFLHGPDGGTHQKPDATG